MAPPIRYARSGDLHIAYWEYGDGPVDLLWVPTWIWESEFVWEEPYAAKMFERMGSFARVITFDRRGAGLWIRWSGRPTLEEQMDDVVAGDGRGRLGAGCGAGDARGVRDGLAVRGHAPERTRALVLYEGMARLTAAPGYEWPLRREEREALADAVEANWGNGDLVLALAYDPYERLREWAGRLERLAASPATAVASYRMQNEIDVRPVLPSIQAPTLVIHRTDDRNIDIRHSRYFAEQIPDARLLELPGAHTLPFGPGQEDLVDEIEEFLTGARRAADTERVLATVMFGDIVDSTRRAAELGDRRWRELLEAFGRVDARCRSSGAALSRTSGTACWRRSTDRPGRSAAPTRCAMWRSGSSTSRCGPAFTPGRSR